MLVIRPLSILGSNNYSFNCIASLFLKGYILYKMQEAIGLMEYSLLKKETSANYNYYSKMYEKYFLLESIID